MSWRDDLPPIPTERIRAESIREGSRRARARQQRFQRVAILGGAAAAVVAVIVVGGVLTSQEDGDDAASSATTASGDAAATVTTEAAAAATTAAAGAETTAAAEGTEAPVDTEAEATTGATAAAVDYTTIGGRTAALPPSPDLRVDPPVIWEQPPSGPVCGPSTLQVTLPLSLASPSAVVNWETLGATGAAPMIVDGDVLRATIGPFAAETLEPGVSYELLVYVTAPFSPGQVQVFRAPTAVLRDCPS